MDIGDKIKSRRNELGFTLKEVADKLGVRDATVQRYESGNIKNLKQETISKLAEILNVKPEWLMGWTDSIPDFSKTKRSTAEETLLSDFHKLNQKGQEAALSAIKGFTCLPEYTEAKNEEVG
jgi:transcriptional regulator with XRE-family HTH domain